MGGRGSSSGYYYNTRTKEMAYYGSEFKSVYEIGNIKFIESNSKQNYAPMETMTKGRVYVVIDKNDNDLKYIVYYDDKGKRKKQIDLKHPHGDMKKHVHHGYIHSEYDGKKGATKLNPKEKKMVERVQKIWLDINEKKK